MAKQLELLCSEYKAIEVVVAGSPVVAGEHATSGLLNGFYLTDAAVGAKATLVTEAEIVKAVKTAGEAWGAGALIYLIAATDVLTTTVGSNIMIGFAHEAAASADTVGYVTWQGDLAYTKL